VANAPLKLPTGVRAALTITISLDIKISSVDAIWQGGSLAWPSSSISLLRNDRARTLSD
jgi:hypothetical protein